MARRAILIYKIYIHLFGLNITVSLKNGFSIKHMKKICYLKIVKGFKMLVPIPQRLKLHPVIPETTKYTL